MNAAQASAFQANSGFTAAMAQNAIIGIVLSIVLVWGVWALHTAYVAWSEQNISNRQLFGVAIRFTVTYVLLTFFLLS